MNTAWKIVGGRLVDPFNGTNVVGDLWIADGRLSHTAPKGVTSGFREIDARGKVVVPGFIDLHVHFREPGNTDAETILTGSRAAAAGGFTTVVTMPNTDPPVDSAERVAWQSEEGRKVGLVRLAPSGCITAGRKGREVADLAAMARAGAVAFTDDGATVADDAVMRKAMTVAAGLGIPVMDHALDPFLAGRGAMNAGVCSERVGLPGIPAEAETSIVARDIRLAIETGARLHLQHLSAAGSVQQVRLARERGARVSAEATPHHLALCDEDVLVERPDAFKMNPPLGSRNDRETLLGGVASGAITVLATDHAPHRAADKAKGFLAAPFGVVGLETAIGVTFTLLVKSGRMSLLDWVRRWTLGPAEVLGGACPNLAAGSVADVAVLDLETPWRVDPDQFQSKGRNTSFAGKSLVGKAVWTFCGGKLVHSPVQPC